MKKEKKIKFLTIFFFNFLLKRCKNFLNKLLIIVTRTLIKMTHNLIIKKEIFFEKD